LRISSQNNQFIFNLPEDFIDKDLTEQFKKLMYKNFIPYDSVISYINSTIKEIVFPSVSFNNIEQTIKYGKTIFYKDSKNIYDTFTRELDITFRSVDSHSNYFILLQAITKFILNNNILHIPGLTISILDKDGDLIYTIYFDFVLLKSISEKRLTYNSSNIAEDTFSVTFAYNYIDIRWELDDNKSETNKSIFDISLNEPDPRDSSRLEKNINIRRKIIKELLNNLK
jgi:hypothetical protein